MNNTTYSLVCGMEIHAELKTQSKMFCGCKNDPFHAEKPNIYTCPVCLGMPGALPVANKKAIEWTIKLGLALGCKINLFSKFDRKHYFYPDLPKGYQISQYDLPFCYDGQIETSEGVVRIRRIHLEEDTGKLLHKAIDGQKVSLIDFNRSSVPLVEVVTEPDIKTAIQAKEYAKKLRQLMRYLEIADCDMEQGGMRLEANVSVREEKSPITELPAYKIELKNINSFRFLEQAIEYEVARQSQALNNGETLSQETRGWNSNENKSFIQRTKEEAADYRYFPDPDLPPIRFTPQQIDDIQSAIPELPEQKAARWQKELGVELRFGIPLITSPAVATQLDDLFVITKGANQDPAKLAAAIYNKKIALDLDNKKTLTDFIQLFATESVSEEELSTIINSIIAANPDAVKKFKQGQQQVAGFFMGQVMKQLKVKADPQQIRAALGKALENC